MHIVMHALIPPRDERTGADGSSFLVSPKSKGRTAALKAKLGKANA